MKNVLTLALILSLSLVLGCPGNNNPSGPSGPTRTSTATRTVTASPTHTVTLASTATPSSTSTPTSTLTETPTPTNTPTRTNTPTLTSTATITLSPTPSVTITFINIFSGNPALSSEAGKRLNPPLYAQIWHPGSTNVTTCPAPGMEIQAGYGAVGTSPSTWSVWIPMACNMDSGNDDLYILQFTSPAPGTYNYAIRGRLNGGPWTYGDWDSSNPNDGYDEPVTLTVATPTVIGTLQPPGSISIPFLSTTPNIHGRVYRAGTTETPGQNGDILAQVGYGPVGTDPSFWTSWYAASFNTQVGNEYEYVGTMTSGTPGTYDYAFRFYHYSDQVWYFADLDNNSNGFSSAQAGQLTVTP